ncbi:hypothetical protein KXD40_006616 [Peronospora effusa]|nr:hypothetical protein KXD40_006616 [Peronospora effusa]
MRASWTILLHGVSLCIGSCVVSELKVTTTSYQNVYEAAKVSSRRSLRSTVMDREAPHTVNDERLFSYEGLEHVQESLVSQQVGPAHDVQKRPPRMGNPAEGKLRAPMSFTTRDIPANSPDVTGYLVTRKH